MSEGYLPPLDDELTGPTTTRAVPEGLFDPAHERDACGVGFIADMKGRKSHRIVADALKILENLEHRGAVGADPLSGDGAGILIQIPHDFLADETKTLGFTLPKPGHYAVGHVFMPQDERLRAHCERVWARCLQGRRLDSARLALGAGRQLVPVGHGAQRRAGASSGVHRAGRNRSRARTSSSAASISSARSSRTPSITPTRAATSATTPCACRRARSSTRACSCRIRSRPTTRICPIRG